MIAALNRNGVLIERRPFVRISKRNKMTKFAGIQKILDDLVGSAPLFKHGRFWQTTRDEFVNLKLFDQCPIIAKKDDKSIGPESPLVTILQEPINCEGMNYPIMPRGLSPIDKDQLQTISDWIDAQCPE